MSIQASFSVVKFAHRSPARSCRTKTAQPGAFAVDRSANLAYRDAGRRGDPFWFPAPAQLEIQVADQPILSGQAREKLVQQPARFPAGEHTVGVGGSEERVVVGIQGRVFTVAG